MIHRLCAGLPALALAALVVLPAAAQSTKLTDGFEGTDFAPEGGLYYRENSEQQAGKVEFQNDVVFKGKGALKLSVRALCPVEDERCSERAEIWEQTDLRVPYDQGVWRGFAVKLADPIPMDDHRYLIAQWKREIDPGADGDFSPFLALRLLNGRLHVTVETNYRPGLDGAKPTGPGTCSPNGVPVWLRPGTNQMRALVAADPNWKFEDGALYDGCTDKMTVAQHNPLPTPDSGWIDFVIYSRPGPQGDGRIELFANGKPIVTVTGMIGHSDKDLGKNQYFKFGPYRAGHSGDWTVYYDEFRRSPDCADVLVGGTCPQF
ncbi:MAG: polysaccharide lyase [Rhizobiaceae bacterium]|nr:polysaccharide lyase [Rhizobiaceae bacterium]